MSVLLLCFLATVMVNKVEYIRSYVSRAITVFAIKAVSPQ